MIFRVGLVLILLADSGFAQSKPSRIAIRQGRGAPSAPSPADAAAMARARADGAVAGKDLVARWGTRPAMTAEGLPTNYDARADAAYKLYVRGEFAAAQAAFDALLNLTYANQAALVQSGPVRAQLQRMLVAQADCFDRLGRPHDARAALMRLHRSFPAYDFSAGAHGPALTTLWQELSRAPRASLSINVNDASVSVYVDAHFVGAGSQTLHLVPGTIHVLAVSEGRVGRVHRVELTAAAPAAVDLAWDVEAFVIEHDGELVIAESADANAVAQGLAALVGSDVALLIRDGATTELAARATTTSRPATPLVVARPPSARRWGRWKYVAAGAGGVAIAVAATLPTALWGHEKVIAGRPNRQRDNVPPAIGVGVAGALLLGAGLYMFATDAPRVTVTPAPRGAYVLLALSW